VAGREEVDEQRLVLQVPLFLMFLIFLIFLIFEGFKGCSAGF